VNQTVLVLGATSAIALAYCRRLAHAKTSFVLIGRRSDRLQTIAADLLARGAAEAVTAVSDLSDITSCERRFDDFCAVLGFPDQVLFAYGLLGDQAKAEEDPAETFRMIDVNFASAAVWLQIAAKRLPRDRPRTIIVIGSVAGERGRRSNYVYGAAKAGLAALTEGLAHRLYGTGLHVLLVKPGLVDTPMTAEFDKSGLLWTDPDTVAACIDRAVQKRRAVVYCPWYWAMIMAIIRFLPRPIFFRTKL
jgi:short-subunit dehydrogenase